MIKQKELIEKMQTISEEYLGWDNVINRVSTNFESVYRDEIGYYEEYFVKAEYKDKKVYFIKREYYFNQKKAYTRYFRTDENKVMLDTFEDIEWFENGDFHRDYGWNDLD